MQIISSNMSKVFWHVLKGERVQDIVTMRDVEGRGGERLRDVMRDVTHVTSAAKPGQWIVDDSASIEMIISTYQNFDLLYCTYCCKCVKSYKKLRCVWNSYRSVGHTTDCKGVRGLWRHIGKGVKSSVTKRETLFFPKIAWRHLWTTLMLYSRHKPSRCWLAIYHRSAIYACFRLGTVTASGKMFY